MSQSKKYHRHHILQVAEDDHRHAVTNLHKKSEIEMTFRGVVDIVHIEDALLIEAVAWYNLKIARLKYVAAVRRDIPEKRVHNVTL